MKRYRVTVTHPCTKKVVAVTAVHASTEKDAHKRCISWLSSLAYSERSMTLNVEYKLVLRYSRKKRCWV